LSPSQSFWLPTMKSRCRLWPYGRVRGWSSTSSRGRARSPSRGFERRDAAVSSPRTTEQRYWGRWQSGNHDIYARLERFLDRGLALAQAYRETSSSHRQGGASDRADSVARRGFVGVLGAVVLSQQGHSSGVRVPRQHARRAAALAGAGIARRPHRPTTALNPARGACSRAGATYHRSLRVPM
jgi:hypothetical protein